MSPATFLNRQALYLRPDPTRVIVRPFKPATEPRDLNPTDKTYEWQKKGTAILNELLPRHRDHPGVAHYIIHGVDYPSTAELGLQAARAYAKIAPDAPMVGTSEGDWPQKTGTVFTMTLIRPAPTPVRK